MNTKMKRYEQQAVLHAKRFGKAWDYFCIATSGYMAGYRDARQETQDLFHSVFDTSVVANLGEEPVEVEMKDGEHQLAVRSFLKWQKEVDNLPFKEALQQLLCNYNFNDIRVHTDENGVVSFQGTARKK